MIRWCTTALLILACGTHVSVGAPRLPNIGYIGYGYNLFLGNPHATSVFDPGFGQAPIFQFVYEQQQTTPDGQWLVPDGVAVPGAATSCSVQDTSSTIQSGDSYQQSLSRDVKFSLGIFGAAFTASRDYKQVYQFTTSEKTVYSSTIASCETYLVNVNPYVHPNFSSTFLNQIARLPTTFDASNAEGFWELFDLVGTHFPTQIVFGSRYGFTFESTSVQWSTLLSSGIDIDIAAGYAGKLHAGIGLNNSYETQMANNFTQQTTSTLEYSLGLAPPSDGNDASWLKDALTSSLMDPLQYSLTEIYELFTSDYSSNPVMLSRYQAVKDALSQYCQLHLVPTGALSTCAAPPPPPPPPPPIGYGALACAAGDNNQADCRLAWTSVFDGNSNTQAQEVVLDFCPGCSVQSTFSGTTCMALAVARNGWTVKTAATQSAAQTAAMSSCTQQGGEGCIVVNAGCPTVPPADARWGAIGCTNGCQRHASTPDSGYTDRIEAHKIAMGLTGPGSVVAVDYDQCGAIVVGKQGWASADGDTPQSATNLAMSTCEQMFQDCQALTYGCVSASSSPTNSTAGRVRMATFTNPL